jgi:uncharacterized protein YbjQ (UPF0145 family)
MTVDPGLLYVGGILVLLVGTYSTGTLIERRHYARIRTRERDWANLPAINFRSVPPGWDAQACDLLVGNVVVSVDYFKRFLAGLRLLVGGRVKSYESLLDRARREALLRLKAQALERGFDAVVNVRLETSRMANRSGDRGTAGVEVLAFGTGLKLRQPPA